MSVTVLPFTAPLPSNLEDPDNEAFSSLPNPSQFCPLPATKPAPPSALATTPPVTLPRLSIDIDASNIDSTAIATDWLAKLNAALSASGTLPATLPQLLTTKAEPWLKDHLALTWSLRTFRTLSRVVTALQDAVATRKPTPLSLISAAYTTINPTLPIIQAQVGFTTDIARCSGVVKLVPDVDGQWRAWCLFTKMDELLHHEAEVSKLDAADGTKVEDMDEVEVLILGAGQTGLQVGSALRTLGVTNLIVEKGTKVGEHWLSRYDSLSLHLSKYYCQLNHRPWPVKVPFYPSRLDVANYLQSYVESTHLSVLASTQVMKATFDEANCLWSVDLVCENGATRVVKAKQMVMATGVNGCNPVIPEIPGKDVYEGKAFHSRAYRRGAEWAGKRAIVIGMGASGHDIAEDLYNSGAEVTMIQRSPTMVVAEEVMKTVFRLYNSEDVPVAQADFLRESTPMAVGQALGALMPVSDTMKEKEAGLLKVGFKVAPADPLEAAYNRGGGHFIDLGTSRLIIDGKIKVKSCIPIANFTPSGLAFADGTTLDAELVVFATGYNTQSMREIAQSIVGEEIGSQLKVVWGLDEEKHLRGMHRNSGHPRIWYAGGDLGMARYYSKILALQIKATQLGVLNDRVELEDERRT